MSQQRIRKGDRVRFRLGTRFVQGVVKEDRGPIGIRGRHLFLIEFPADPGSPFQIELPSEEFEVERDAVTAE